MWPGLLFRLQSKDERIVQLKNRENLWINDTWSNILIDNDSLTNLIIQNSCHDLNVQAKSVPAF